MTEDNKSYLRELHRVEQQEAAFVKRRGAHKTSLMNAMLGKKIPDKLRETLEEVIHRSLWTMLEKGTNGLERSLNREGKEARWEKNVQHAQILRDSSSIHNLGREAGKDGAKSTLLSAMTGMGLGTIGVGVLDIPVFTAMLLREAYTHALNYGYHYDSDEEKYFILLLLRGAFTSGPALAELDRKASDYTRKCVIPENTDLIHEIRKTSKAISDEILCSKFVQGIPMIGIVGGAYNALYMARLAEYADIKYRKRMLNDYGPSLNAQVYNPVHVIRSDNKTET